MDETFDEHLIRIGAGIRADNAAKEEAARNAPADAEKPAERVYRYALRGEEARHAAGGNGGPRLDDVFIRPGVGLLLKIGRHLFGDRHTTDLGRVVVEDGGVVRRWRRGEGGGPNARHMNLLRLELVRRIDKLQKDLKALDDFREERGWVPTRVPPPPPPAPEVILAPGVRPEDAAWFIERLAAATGGKPTFVRVVLAAKCPPRGRHWTADVVIFDGSRQTLDCDRTADLGGESVGFASAAPGRPEPWIHWDDQVGGWVRGPDWGSDAMKARLAEVRAEARGGQV
ncbi:hypothetical protein [Methylobacterium hispanicum]|uniref:hypothetical protein n=1 Tax=Methylobacterium hispanicum TaxID=270350 RepID=UPI002F309490